MRIAVSVPERKAAKRKLKKQIKDHDITMTQIEARSPFHYNTVRDAFDVDKKYWNQKVVDLALEMIEEKKTALTNSK